MIVEPYPWVSWALTTEPPRPLLPQPKPRWIRWAKRLDGADVRREASSRISTRKRALR
jgi:hypothetical protein